MNTVGRGATRRSANPVGKSPAPRVYAWLRRHAWDRATRRSRRRAAPSRRARRAPRRTRARPRTSGRDLRGCRLPFRGSRLTCPEVAAHSFSASPAASIARTSDCAFSSSVSPSTSRSISSCVVPGPPPSRCTPRACGSPARRRARASPRRSAWRCPRAPGRRPSFGFSSPVLLGVRVQPVAAGDAGLSADLLRREQVGQDLVAVCEADRPGRPPSGTRALRTQLKPC